MYRPLLLVLFATGCMHAGPPQDIGLVTADRTPLSDSPPLAHLPSALGITSGDVVDLYTDELRFTRVPDPTDHMVTVTKSNIERYNKGPALSVVSYNVALLDAKVFWVVPYAETPHLEERRPVLAELVLDADYDVFLLQEVWLKKDQKVFEEAAASHGYAVYNGPTNDGLLTLVRSSLLAPGTALQGRTERYLERDGLETFPGPGIRRGFSEVVFQHPEAGPIALYNTHMLAWPANWRVRMAQARQLGLAVAAKSPELGAEPVAILGGDLNGGPYYPRDAWILPTGEPEAGWFANTLSYSLMLHYGGLDDIYLLGRAPHEARDDREVSDTIPTQWSKLLEEPMGDAEWCRETHGKLFTATDCTQLYFDQYAGTEFPARMDHLMVHDPSGRVFVEQSGLAFTENVVIPGLPPMPPSDHLGVTATLRVYPAGAPRDEEGRPVVPPEKKAPDAAPSEETEESAAPEAPEAPEAPASQD